MFAERLKALRREKEITQTEFARTFHISNGTIGNWESGKRQPDYETLKRIADYFSVSIDYLLGSEPEPETADTNPWEEEIQRYLAKPKNMINVLLDRLDENEQKQILDYIYFLLSKKDNPVSKAKSAPN